MKNGLSRRDLLAGTGAALGAAIVAGATARTALGTVSGKNIARWGIAVDVARCASQNGCRRCIDACHVVHRVPAVADPRHEVKWMWKEPFVRVFPEQVHSYEAEARVQTPVLVLCNHCKNAPCTRVCPTGATWCRSNGVVAMDEHRCIGCRYCMAACPYGSRSFNWERAKAEDNCDGQSEELRSACAHANYPTRAAGVVEKCNLCVERIDVGQIPLCVETCRNLGIAALTFGNLEDANSSVRQLLATRQVLRRRPSLGTEPRIFYLV